MNKTARLSLAASALVAGVFAFWGGWSRRWMSDDGLIVLRTVRNLLAGNGPVFNAGERVEANTSALWQYMIAAGAWVTNARLEDVAMWLALALTVVACVVASWAAARFWADAVVPFGILIYLALPPARDFATSGLEWGLSICWLAVWWALSVRWASPTVHAPRAPYWLAFWCGLSWLVRPELALYGGVTGLLLLWEEKKRWWGVLLAALPVPAVYQIFRMGYYGLATPHTAVAKSAGESAWSQGAGYVGDFLGPYALWLPLALAVAVGIVLMRGSFGRERAVVVLVLGCALVHVVYVVRVGGDFMHGRMLLLPLFALLLPVAVVPLTRATGVAALVVALWAGPVIARSHPGDIAAYTSRQPLGIVDEREFWTWATRNNPGDAPLHAEDFMRWKVMPNWADNLQAARASGAAALSMDYTPDSPGAPERFTWTYLPRGGAPSDLSYQPLTGYWVNLGMTSMNADLDTRVLDTVGLATPLSARMPRIPDGRVGHDRDLPLAWQLADTDVDVSVLAPDLRREVMQARAALRTPKIAELLASSREPMSPRRFAQNLGYALTGGRSLRLDDDPASYLDHTTLSRIDAGEDVGRGGPQIAWPRES